MNSQIIYEKYYLLLQLIKDSNKSKKKVKEAINEFIECLSLYPNLHENIFVRYRVLKKLRNEIETFRNEILSKGESEFVDEVLQELLEAFETELEIVHFVIKQPDLMKFQSENGSIPDLLTWTESKISLVELIYSISQSVDEGKTSIKSIVQCFEFIFQTDLGNFYQMLSDIGRRKSSQTRYLDTLPGNLQLFLDKMDSKI